MKFFIIGLIFTIVLSCCLTAAPCFAERPSTGLGKWLQEVGVYTGFVTGKLKRQGHFDIYPIGMRFGFDLKPFTKKFGVEPKGILELVYEPFIGAVSKPKANVELGLPIFIKYAYPLTNKFYPYLEVGAGPYYTSLHTYEQGTQFDFIDQGGGGIMFFIKEDLALNVGYRYRHVSNAGIEKPNAGIEASVYHAGISWYF